MSADGPRQLRVLLAAPSSAGGIGRHVAMLAGGLAERGHLVTVAAPDATLTLVARDPGITTVAVELGGRRAWRAGRTLRALAGGHDVVHAHGVRVGAQAALAGVRPLVATWHNAPLGPRARRAVHRLLEMVSARGSAVVLGASRDLVDRARSAGSRDARFAPVAAPGLAELAELAAGSARTRAPRTPPAALTVVAIGRLHPQKRLDLLLDATAGWADEPDRPTVLVAGDGPLRSALEAHAQRVRSPARFLGASTDVAGLLAVADVVVLPSAWEARPLVAQEALSAGVPLLATDVGGVRDLVGDAAVLVPPGDAEALRGALERVMSDPDLRIALAQAGRLQAQSWPTAEDMVSQVEQIYLSLDPTSRP